MNTHQPKLQTVLARDGDTGRSAVKEGGAASPASLSDVHEMLATTVERVGNPIWLNKIANSPEVLPHIKGWLIPPLDMSAVVENRENVCLAGEFGAVIFHAIQPGIVEGHSMCLKAGRGSWMLEFAQACEMYLFCRTPHVEIIGRAPAGNYRVAALMRRLGWHEQFTAARGWVVDGDPVPTKVFSRTLQDWSCQAPGLEERGHWFHERLEEEFKRHGKTEPPHPDDAVHDRYAGLAYEMAIGGQPFKAQAFYQRFAAVADYVPFVVINNAPVTVDIQTAILIIKPDGDFWCPVVR